MKTSPWRGGETVGMSATSFPRRRNQRSGRGGYPGLSSYPRSAALTVAGQRRTSTVARGHRLPLGGLRIRARGHLGLFIQLWGKYRVRSVSRQVHTDVEPSSLNRSRAVGIPNGPGYHRCRRLPFEGLTVRRSCDRSDTNLSWSWQYVGRRSYYGKSSHLLAEDGQQVFVPQGRACAPAGRRPSDVQPR